MTVDPAGMTTRPDASFTSDVTLAVTVSPTLLVRDEICALVVARMVVPAERLRVPVVDAVVLDVDVFDVDDVLVRGAGVVVRVGVREVVVVVVVTAVSAARSLSLAEVSTGASCKSRFRLSAAAVSAFSPRAQAASAATPSAASIILDIIFLLEC
ncbi:MAG: hypothetical protein H0U85_04890 [Gemmatimonadales bacterium]|nr:hypothetical protein [Gemmatimonadales bacterium]